MKRIKAFTSFEVLTVIFMIGLIVVLIILLVNPQKRLAEMRNSRRSSDVQAISNAINQYIIDNQEAPAGIDNSLRIIGQANSGCNIRCGRAIGASSCLNLRPSLVPKYLSDIPSDYLLGDSNLTYYAVKMSDNNRIIVYSCKSELGVDLTVSQ
ncbi:MAG: hypothetical protein WC564_04280 [Patescibacteria group bacterium]